MEAHVTRMTWRDQLWEVPRSAWYAIRRCLRREPRWFMVVDGRIVGRFASSGDSDLFLKWLSEGHQSTFRLAHELGKEHARAEAEDDASDPRTP